MDDDARAYLIYSSIAEDHAISIERLSDDYLSSTKENGGTGQGLRGAGVDEARRHVLRLVRRLLLFLPSRERCPRLRPASRWDPTRRNTSTSIATRAARRSSPPEQTDVARIPTANGVSYIWMGDRWGSRPDGSGARFQYWGPLDFDASGNILPLKWADQWKIELP